MDEDVASAIVRSDETEALRLVEEFDRAARHDAFSDMNALRRGQDKPLQTTPCSLVHFRRDNASGPWRLPIPDLRMQRGQQGAAPAGRAGERPERPACLGLGRGDSAASGLDR